MDKYIMPECYADTLLMEILVPTKKGYNHKHSCSAVTATMEKGILKDKFAVGIIDNDKKKVKYLGEFEQIDSVGNTLVLWKHRNEQKHHYFIQICPALEYWILNVCKESGIDIKQFDLADDLNGLKYFTKSVTSEADVRLNKLFKEVARQEVESVRKLRGWINLLKDRNYNIDIKELKDV